MSDTPRTDAEAWPLEHANLDVEQVVSADFARTLERELAAALLRLEAWSYVHIGAATYDPPPEFLARCGWNPAPDAAVGVSGANSGTSTIAR
ncbi:MAG TPA: hypothetical protein VHV32_18990 [Candidatus Angelobacter sp.]|jgi:3-isopropylmalate dehydratase small subunit|nr:hypothetical protein [Candidatus Angelobacter sp.]